MMAKLARYYFGYGFVVGGLLFLLMLVATQAAHSGAEAFAAIVLGLVAPVPMFFLGHALRRGWRAAPLLCALAPLLLAIVVARVWGQPQPPRADGVWRSAVFNAEYSRLYFLPGAVVLAVIVLVRALRERVGGVTHTVTGRQSE